MNKIKSMTVTQKGQVTLPKSIRDFLKIQPRGRVSFSIKNNKVVIESSLGVDDLFNTLPETNQYRSDNEIKKVLKNRHE